MESPLPHENEFKRKIYEKYKAHFDHFYLLHQLAEWALVEYGALTKDAYHATVQLILPRALKSFDSHYAGYAKLLLARTPPSSCEAS